jgi:class 3 adenylate cyclase
MAVEPTFGYARASDGAYIAYSTMGEGPIDLVWQFDWFGNVDAIWEDRDFRALFEGMAGFARLILHDRRATGLSSRDVDVPNLETRVSDLVAVLDTVGSDRPILGGQREGGAPNLMLAATQPDRVRSLIWYAPSARSVWAPDFPWGATPDYVARERASLEAWGTSRYGSMFIETEASGGHEIRGDTTGIIAKLSRNTATPDIARRLSDVWYETDVRSLLPSVTAPTLLLQYEGAAAGIGEMEYVAERMTDVRTVVLPGAESDGEMGSFLDELRRFIGIDRAPSLDTVLTTVLFTDIVDSTAVQARLGDRGWKDLIERHHALVRDHLQRFRGQEQDTAGDGFYARFDGPARAIHCAREIADRVRDLGVEVRAGVHTGECEVADGKCSGLSVSIGARVMAHAGRSEVLVSQTVKDLVAGSGLAFEDAGEHELKGVPDRWRLYRVVT